MTAQQSSRAGTRQAFSRHQDGALALLSMAAQGAPMEIKVGQFLGSCVARSEISDRMSWWLGKLLREAGLPPIDPTGE